MKVDVFGSVRARETSREEEWRAGTHGLVMWAITVVAGLALLHQTLAPHEVAGIGVVMLANTVATIEGRGRWFDGYEASVAFGKETFRS